MRSLQLGVEFIQNKGVYLKGQTWKSDGCQFYFPGANADPLNICPAMTRPDCYVYNGAVCCASECPGKCTAKGGGCCRGTCESFRCGEKLKNSWVNSNFLLPWGRGRIFWGIIYFSGRTNGRLVVTNRVKRGDCRNLSVKKCVGRHKNLAEPSSGVDQVNIMTGPWGTKKRLRKKNNRHALVEG